MLMCGSEDLVGCSVSTYLKSRNAKVTSVPWQLMIDSSSRHRHRTMIFNIISHEQSYADFILFLNKNRFKLYDNTVVIVADSCLAKICVELLYVEKAIVLTDKSPLRDFGRLTTLASGYCNPRLFRSQKKLTDREQQILSLLVSGYSPNDIASLLSLSYKTIQTHKMKIILKLGLTHTAELNKLIVKFNQRTSFLP